MGFYPFTGNQTVNGALTVTSDITAQGKMRASGGFVSTPPVVSTPGVPAASTNLTNTTGFDCTVYIFGGAGVAVSVAGGATGLAAGTFLVPANANINLGAYTAAPSWLWQAT